MAPDRNSYEILAPAGSREALAAACQAGADAVYFGVGTFSMRARSSSPFRLEDLPETAAMCRDRGVRTYLTVNTIVYDEETDLLRRVLDAAAAAGVDAVIAQDIAVVMACADLGLPVHLSTQMNISNIRALEFYARWADAAVLARELSLEQVARIRRAILERQIRGPSGELIRLEMFCHGAMCMAVSGKCWMSLHTRSRSASRGECTQPCRRPYDVLRDEGRGVELVREGHRILSPRDLKTIGFMDRMVAAGVQIFKIEGRARSPEYVHTVTACYREALERVLSGTWDESCRTAWDERLASVFNRGFWDGYYLGEETMKLAGGDGSRATKTKVWLGTCTNYFSRAGVGQFTLQAHEVSPGDELVVIGPTTGVVEFRVETLHHRGREVPSLAAPAEDLTLAVPEKVRPNDRLYRLEPAGG